MRRQCGVQTRGRPIIPRVLLLRPRRKHGEPAVGPRVRHMLAHQRAELLQHRRQPRTETGAPSFCICARSRLGAFGSLRTASASDQRNKPQEARLAHRRDNERRVDIREPARRLNRMITRPLRTASSATSIWRSASSARGSSARFGLRCCSSRAAARGPRTFAADAGCCAVPLRPDPRTNDLARRHQPYLNREFWPVHDGCARHLIDNSQENGHARPMKRQRTVATVR
jgi:hypothetical protein